MKYLIAILLLASTALAQNNSGTLVIAPIRPQASNDTFPSAIANEIQGGPFSVATTAAMSNIPSARLVPGALAYVTNDSLFRMWDGASWSESELRSGIGLGAAWLTNDNVTNFRTAIGLGENDGVIFDSLTAINFQATAGTNYVQFNSYSVEFGGISASRTRTNLGLGPTNIVTFAGLTNNGDITINSTTASNGLLFIRRTNNEPFLGLANLIASNNTTISNDTLFRVGVAEATNQSAQFGFRSTNTNGNGVAVFSVFGYNALMMIGADASTNAVVYSGGGTNNEVMTLIRDGATEFARPIRFSTNASTRPATNAPATNNVVAAWVEMRIGTNSYRVPLYQ